MEALSFSNVKYDLRVHFKKAGYKSQTIGKKIFVFKGNYITIFLFHNPKKKCLKVYYVDSFSYWIYKVGIYYSDKESIVLNRIKKYIKEIEDKKYGIF